MGNLTQGILKLDLGAKGPRQPHSTRPLSEIFFFFLELQRYRVKVSLITDTTTFLKALFCLQLSYFSRADWLISINMKRTDTKF